MKHTVSQTVDRTKRPEIRRIERLSIIPAEKRQLGNGLPVYVINQGTQDVCSIELNFNAGKWQQQQKLVARFTNLMLREGTRSYTSKELSEKLDFYGAFLRTHSGTDRASVSLVSLNKHLMEVFPLFAEVVREPVFPENELETALTNSRQRLKVNKTKNDYLADRAITRLIFGSEHPYGSEPEDADYDKVNSEVLKKFYAAYYTGSNCYMMVSGKISDDTMRLIEKYFDDTSWSKTASLAGEREIKPSPELKYRQKTAHAVQSSIRIGKRLFNKTHPDFQKLQVLNTLLGGFFGSRLMTNIREEKGYTYGIHSGLSSLVRDGYFFVNTEVGSEVVQDALNEIYKEINRLKTELIPEDELELVRNYLSGKILSGLDGPFRLADFYNGLIIYGLDIDYVHRLLHTVKTVTPQELKELAQKYLNTEEMYEVVVG